MAVPAIKIDEWAKTKAAQALLPRLVRKLIHARLSPDSVNFPSGESTSLPGWDGELSASGGDAWIPNGQSFWELSCERKVSHKASEDYRRRTKSTQKQVRQGATFVAVSARKWSRKQKWVANKRRGRSWANVVAIDADSLEQWLEQCPAVSLWFEELLGLTGVGVVSTERCWESWSAQVDPPISAQAILAGREQVSQELLKESKTRSEANTASRPLNVAADSIEEASAFAAASILTNPALTSCCVVLTDASGWRFVEQNSGIRIVIVSSAIAAASPTMRPGLCVIIPSAIGGHMGASLDGEPRRPELVLERADAESFQRSLASMGLPADDAGRLTGRVGRSWSVFRRLRATNPQIREPRWLTFEEARSLSTVCLLGHWTGAKEADKQIVAGLSGRPYETVERDLRRLAQLDDAPVLSIGQAWTAKAPIELLLLVGPLLTNDEIGRFLSVARSLLTAPDPQLELPEKDRFAAQIYKKVRPESGFAIAAICDSLVKLSVHGAEINSLAQAQVPARIAALVRDVLGEATEVRWLSVASLLPALAEAAPDAFLTAIEQSLSSPAAPVRRLMTETSGGMFGRCWHAGLLWALEVTAWAPASLSRVALILASLSKTQIGGNWGNTPLASLYGLFRSWFPQTAASVSQRLAALDALALREPDVAFEIMLHLIDGRGDSATSAARPRWRHDDRGAGHVASDADRRAIVQGAAERILPLATRHPARVAKLVAISNFCGSLSLQSVFELARGLGDTGIVDQEREVVQAAIRKLQHWIRNFETGDQSELEKLLLPSESVLALLSPADVVIRHRWLFTGSWIELPIRSRELELSQQEAQLAGLRLRVLHEILSSEGLAGVDRLAGAAGSPFIVGATLAKAGVDPETLLKWVVAKSSVSTDRGSRSVVSGFLRALPPTEAEQFLRGITRVASEARWLATTTASLLALARDEKLTWDVVEGSGPEVVHEYWRLCTPGIWGRLDTASLDTVLQKLLDAGRPRTAFALCHFPHKNLRPATVATVLELVLTKEEDDGPAIESWHMVQAIEFLENDAEFPRDRLVGLEFYLIPYVGQDGGRHCKSLFEKLMSDAQYFTEVLCFLYKAANGGPREATDLATLRARIAADILRGCCRQPGTTSDGKIDEQAFMSFIEQARNLCRAADRSAVGDSTLGEILAHVPSGKDGKWPIEAARELLDRVDLEDMRDGLFTGILNGRGMTCHALDELGEQERALAERYRAQARALEQSHPRLAAVLLRVALAYESEGAQVDIRVRARQEGLND